MQHKQINWIEKYQWNIWKIENPQKMFNPDENQTKLTSKPSKNKKFKRNEHRKVPEMNEKKQKMRKWVKMKKEKENPKHMRV